MANEGFRGDRILIQSLGISPGDGGLPLLTCSIAFSNEDGTIHAVAQHRLLLDAEGDSTGLVAAVTELMQRLTRRVEALHFTRPNETEASVLKGIAEVLGVAPTTPDEPGSQG